MDGMIHIEKVDGDWPEWARKAISDEITDVEPWEAAEMAVEILDALEKGTQ